MNIIKQKHPLLLILPVVYIILAGLFFVYWRPFYTIGPDPAYIYLFNGINIASGNVKIFYIDNPGIPVQVFSAVVIYMQHLFNHRIPLYQDVIMRPESYLYVLCTTVGILYALITLATGQYVFRRTGNILVALTFQLTPLIGKETLGASSASPESFMVIIGMLFIAYLYCNSIFTNPQPTGKKACRHILIYGAFSGFLVATKYTCFPLIILVLVLLPTLRLRLQYFIYFILFFLVFILPALPAFGRIIQWISDLATHTGHYGQGDKGFVNTSEFLINLGNIFKEDCYFTSLIILLWISLLLAVIKYKKIQQENKIYLRLLFGVGVSSALLIIMVAKHYSFHYLIPVRLCFPLILVGSYGVFRNILKIVKNKLVPQVLFYSLFIFLIFSNLKLFLKYPPHPASNIASNFLDKYKDVPLIITSEFESSRIEPALEIGVVYTGSFRNKYWEFMKKVYPYSYRYTNLHNRITYWDDVFYMPELFVKYPKVLVYFNDKDSDTRIAMLNELCMWKDSVLANNRLVCSSRESNEYIYELDGNQKMAKELMALPEEIRFDFEKVNDDKSKFVSMDGKYTFDAINASSNKEHYSGNNSILVSAKNQYTTIFPIKALPGNMINISAWRKSDDGMGGIVFSSKTNPDFYDLGHAVIDSNSNGWKRVEYKCLVPPSIKDSTVMFYFYYYGHGYAYFDNLSIKVFPMKLNNDHFISSDPKK
jgi:hypothetical protein